MKKTYNYISPFIILLIPVLLVVALLAINPINTDESEHISALSSYDLPELKGLIQVIFSIR